ncbi:MAG: type II toxin-antitoxin system HicA family toxin [Chloroflexi bacterium]|nr:type II toxin-antitoxin system HicA family toxin [Chloroflexota bacterium]
MTKRQKLLKKITRGSKNIRFDELIGLIEGFGFRLNRISGSHHIFEHPDVAQGISLQPDKNNQAKPYQIKQFLRLVEMYNLQLEDDEPIADDEPEDEQE